MDETNRRGWPLAGDHSRVLFEYSASPCKIALRGKHCTLCAISSSTTRSANALATETEKETHVPRSVNVPSYLVLQFFFWYARNAATYAEYFQELLLHPSTTDRPNDAVIDSFLSQYQEKCVNPRKVDVRETVWRLMKQLSVEIIHYKMNN